MLLAIEIFFLGLLGLASLAIGFVSVVVLVGSPDAQVGSGTQQHQVRGLADEFLKSFDWDTR